MSGQSVNIYFTLADAQGQAIFDPKIDTASLVVGDQKYDAHISVPNTPLYISLVIDTSGSMKPAFQKMVDAAVQAVDVAPEGTRFSVITFNEQVTVRIGFEGNRDTVKATLQKITQNDFNGGTCLYKATDEAINQPTGGGAAPRRAIVLFTDGKDELHVGKGDTCSQNIDFSGVVTEGRSDNIPVYTIGLTGQQRADETELHSLAQSTGGLYAFGDESKLGELFQNIIHALESQRVAQVETCLPANTYSGVLSVNGSGSALSAPVNNLRVTTSCSIPTITPTPTATSTPIALTLTVDSFHNEPPNLVFNINRSGSGDVASYRVQINDKGNMQIDSSTWRDFTVPYAGAVTSVSVPLSELKVDDIVIVITALNSAANSLGMTSGSTTPRRTATPTATPLPSATATDEPLTITLGTLRPGSTTNERRFSIFRTGNPDMVIDHYQVDITADGHTVGGQYGSFPVPETGPTTLAKFYLDDIQSNTVKVVVSAIGISGNLLAPPATIDQVKLDFTATPLPTATSTPLPTATLAPTATSTPVTTIDIPSGAMDRAENGDFILHTNIQNPAPITGYTVFVIDSNAREIYSNKVLVPPGDEILISKAEVEKGNKGPLDGGAYTFRIILTIPGQNPPLGKDIEYTYVPPPTPTPTPPPSFMEQISATVGRVSTQVRQTPLLAVALVAFILALAALIAALIWWLRDRRRQRQDRGYVAINLAAAQAGDGDTEINDDITAELVLVQSPGMTPGEKYKVSSSMPAFVLGRNPETKPKQGIVFQEKGVSKDHATISFDRNQFAIVDENSANGTFLNGEQLVPGRSYSLPVDPVPIIGLGRKTELRFEFAQPKATGPTSTGMGFTKSDSSAQAGAAPAASGDANRLPTTVKAALTVVESPDLRVGTVFPIETKTFWIGTTPENQLVLRSSNISRKHTLLYWENGSFYIRDDQSSNDTWLDGQKLEKRKPTALSAGRDYEVSLGRHTKFRFAFNVTRSDFDAFTDIEDEHTTIEKDDKIVDSTMIDQDVKPPLAKEEEESTMKPKPTLLDASGLPRGLTAQLIDVKSGRQIEFKDGKAYLNRATFPDELHLSTHHAVVFWDSSQHRFYLQDEKSRHGTFLDQTKLASGDQIMLEPNKTYQLVLAKNTQGPFELKFFYNMDNLPGAKAPVSPFVEDTSSQTLIDEPPKVDDEDESTSNMLRPNSGEHTEL